MISKRPRPRGGLTKTELIEETERLRRDLAEALEQQTATGEILQAISRSRADLQQVFDTIAERAAWLCQSFDVNIWQRDGDQILLVAHYGPIPVGFVAAFGLPLIGTVGGRSVLDGRTIQTADVRAEADAFPDSAEHARLNGYHTMLSVPMMRDGVAIGAIVLRRTEVKLFTDRQVALLQTFADQAIIAIENVRLFNETAEALERQTATSEILKVISESPTDVQPVLDAVVESAARLCEAEDVSILEPDRDVFRVAALRGASQIRAFEGTPVTRGSVAGRAILDGRLIHVHDITTEADSEFPVSKAFAQQVGHRTMVATPLLRKGVPIGTIFVRRMEVRPFSDKQIALLQTFADQAVIAIENVRLFKELEARNLELTETLARQTATAEILGVISSSPTDIQPVLDVVARNAGRLCGAEDATIYLAQEGFVRVVAHYGPVGHATETTRMPIARDSASGRAVVDRQIVNVVDIAAADDEFPRVAPMARRLGHRTTMAGVERSARSPTGRSSS